jgi:catechol 2,3-dioxygenase-like lactoylglutathione lyase family enzyme
MSDLLTTLFNDFDRGRLSRRRLLQALGLAAAARPVSALAFGQGQCADRGRAGAAGCDTTPAKFPFEPTGWKTVLLDHFTIHVADYQKEAAYYDALMNWHVRSDDGSKAVLDIGDWGGLVLVGGYQPPPPAPRPPPRADASGNAAATGAGAAGGATGAGGGAAGGGRGGGGGRGNRPPNNSLVSGFCWGIEPWDQKKVEAELRKRGLEPVADNDDKNHFQSFHVKDPDGFDLQISNGNSKNRRQGKATAKLKVPAPFEATSWKTIWLDHISFQVMDYKESVAFYTALLGWTGTSDEGSQNQCQIGDVGDVIIRGRQLAQAAAAGNPAPPRKASIDHIAFGITPFDPDAVKAELDKRGLQNSVDTGNRGDIHTASYKSYHTTTPNGFTLQISDTTKATREPK